jgi:phenylpyruvate tautomerase PptA (4-oxalocrotonate tautomerase family)
MPIIDVRPVVSDPRELPADAAQVLADSIAQVLGAKPGRVWVRLSELPKDEYAENGEAVEDNDLPVFVSVLLADWPRDDDKVQQARELAVAVAASLGRQVERVHIEYAPPGRGRVAFGGKLVV